jgi:broad specificity phosphatase PhoE
MADALTADPTPAPRPGAIVLARHGEPAISRKVLLSPRGYADFWGRYELQGLVPGQVPPSSLVEFAAQADVCISSTRLRSVESAQALAVPRPFEPDPIFIEAPLPKPPFPGFIRLSPKIWGFIARFCWWFFNNHGGQETRRQAEARADQAAGVIEDLAASGQDVVVLAHGFFNFMIGRSLKARGWKMVEGEGYKYWSTRRYERM